MASRYFILTKVHAFMMQTSQIISGQVFKHFLFLSHWEAIFLIDYWVREGETRRSVLLFSLSIYVFFRKHLMWEVKNPTFFVDFSAEQEANDLLGPYCSDTALHLTTGLQMCRVNNGSCTYWRKCRWCFKLQLQEKIL